MSKINASLQAFIEQIQNWELTLHREAKKLKQVKKNVKSKFKLNSIEISLVQIESQFIYYKKIKERLSESSKQKSLTSDSVLNQYSISSRRFMEILQKIANINSEEDREDQAQNVQVLSNLKNNEQKSFLQETFSFKVSKNDKKKSKSYFQTRKKDNSVNSSINTYYKKPLFQIKQIQTKNKGQNESTISANYLDRKRISASQINVSELYGIKQQLAQIKGLMKEMHSQILYHDHQEINKQMEKIQNCNRKMGTQLKALKEENKYILSKIQSISDNLQEQKRLQAQMIQKIQKKQNKSTSFIQNSAKNSLKNKQKNDQQNLSDWVKIRI